MHQVAPVPADDAGATLTRNRSQAEDMLGVERIGLFAYIMETAAYSLLVSIAPVLASVAVYVLGDGRAMYRDMLLDYGSTFYAPEEYRNITTRAPGSEANLYFQDGVDLSHAGNEAMKDSYALGAWMFQTWFLMHGLLGVFVFQPSRAGVAATALLTMLLFIPAGQLQVVMQARILKLGSSTTSDDTAKSAGLIIVLLQLFGIPLIKLTSWAFTDRKGGALKLYGLLLLDNVIAAIVTQAYSWFMLARFTAGDASLVELLLLRTVLHTAFISLTTSFHGWLHHHLVEDFGTLLQRLASKPRTLTRHVQESRFIVRPWFTSVGQPFSRTTGERCKRLPRAYRKR
jgi:hypothetical protein